MGVPKFYRWISERYPCLSEVVKEHQIPEFDNLYLDMNGIIHICSHPNDDDPHFRISEADIFKDIFHYIEVLFRMIQPLKVFYMAVDGVAPRAKMNQQRGRRFRSAREAEDNEQKARAKGETLPTEARFDSNCITPGTEFMTKLDAQLRYFISSKISTDKLWQNCSVIYSGHKTPGEGEHKIMEYIRYSKSQPNYDPNTRHCLYGLDADLIMLGLTSHEPHFSLLREEVRFGGKKGASKRTPTPEETTFHLLHLCLMREYIEYEFYELHDTISFKFDLEAIIDDWVFMGFLVGNDFIPHLPGLHINRDALPLLYETYKKVLPEIDGYLNENGYLNLKRFEKFMEVLTEYDIEKFQEMNDNMKYIRSKKAGNVEQEVNARVNELVAFDFEDDNVFGSLEDTPLTSEEVRESLSRLDIQPCDLLEDDDDLYDENSQFEAEFWQHKRNYYMTKMGFEDVPPEVLRDQATQYVRGLQWILHYYYNGICSWSWYYPHHYAPYISDVKKFADIDTSFDKAKPFLPFEQLLAVLPPLSVKLLPEAYHRLMLDEDSELKEFYPKEFETDLNGKQQDWEAVVLIPFIDEELLLMAMGPCNEVLTEDEKERNSHGPMHICTYTTRNLGEYKAPDSFPTISVNRAVMQPVWREDWDLHPSQLTKGLLPGVKLNVFFAGFPSLKHLKHTFRRENASVKVFQQESRGENFILEVTKQNLNILDMKNILGKTVFVRWPHLIEAKVLAVCNEKCRYYVKSGSENPIREELDRSQVNFFNLQKEDLESQYMKRWGVDIDETEYIVFAKQITGRTYVPGVDGKVTLEKQWSEIDQPYPLQTTVKDITIHDPGYKQYKTIQEFFTPGSHVFMLGQPHYGCMGEIIEIDPKNNERVRVSLDVPVELDLNRVKYQYETASERYMRAFECATRLQMSAQLFARLTGSVFMMKAQELNPFQEETGGGHKINIGLNLKSNKKSEEVVGFTKKEIGSKHWLYSEQCLKTLEEYQRLFPDVFEYLNQNPTDNDVFQDKMFPKNYKERVPELSKWLKEAPFSTAERCKWGTQFIDAATVAEISKEVDKTANLRSKRVPMSIKPHLLFKPNPLQGSTPPDRSVKFRLFDRVINVREGFSVPLGALGVVIGTQPAERDADKMYTVLFDQPFVGGLTLAGPTSAQKCYRLTWSSMINITHGEFSKPRTSIPRESSKPNTVTNSYSKAINPKYSRKLPEHFVPMTFVSATGPTGPSTSTNNTSEVTVLGNKISEVPVPGNQRLPAMHEKQLIEVLSGQGSNCSEVQGNHKAKVPGHFLPVKCEVNSTRQSNKTNLPVNEYSAAHSVGASAVALPGSELSVQSNSSKPVTPGKCEIPLGVLFSNATSKTYPVPGSGNVQFSSNREIHLSSPVANKANDLPASQNMYPGSPNEAKSPSNALQELLRSSGTGSRSFDDCSSPPNPCQLPKPLSFRKHLAEAQGVSNNNNHEVRSPPRRQNSANRSFENKKDTVRQITSENDVALVLHGNFFHNWPFIREYGLKRDHREYIPCVSYVPPKLDSSRSYEILIYLNIKKLLKDGIKLLVMPKGQVLCSTKSNGFVPPDYFEKVVEAASGRLLFPLDGQRGFPSHGPVSHHRDRQERFNSYDSNSWHGMGMGRGRGGGFVQQPMNIHENISSQMRDASGGYYPEQYNYSGGQNFFQRNMNYNNPGHSQSQTYYSQSHPAQQNASQSKFVPTQVARKQTSPRKPQSARYESPHGPSTPSQQDQKKNNPNAVGNKTGAQFVQKPKKKPRNRLAANIGGFSNG